MRLSTYISYQFSIYLCTMLAYSITPSRDDLPNQQYNLVGETLQSSNYLRKLEQGKAYAQTDKPGRRKEIGFACDGAYPGRYLRAANPVPSWRLTLSSLISFCKPQLMSTPRRPVAHRYICSRCPLIPYTPLFAS